MPEDVELPETRVPLRGDSAVDPVAGGSTRRQVRVLRDQLLRYRRVLVWLFRDALLRFRRHTVTAALLGYLGLISQGLALGVMIAYARAIEQGAEFSLLGRTADPRSELWMLTAVAGVMIIVLAAAAGFIYLSRLKAYDLVREYEEFSTRRIYRLLARLPSPRSPQASANLTDRKTYQLLRDARYSARILILMIFSFQAAVTVIVAYMGLLIINAPLSLTITALIVISLAFLYRVSIWGARHSIRLEKHAPGAALEKRRILTYLKRSPAPAAVLEHQIDTMLHEGTTKRFLDAYIGRLRQPESSKLVTNLLTAAALFSILVVEGNALLKGRDNWSTLLVYLIALRYFLNNLSTVANTYTKLNRFFPLLRSHQEFVADASKAAEIPPPVAGSYELCPPAPALDGGPIPTLGRGDVAGLLLPGPLTRFSLGGLIGSLGVEPQRLREIVLSSYRLCLMPEAGGKPTPSVRQVFGFVDSYDDDRLRRDLGDLVETSSIPALDSPASEKVLGSLPEEVAAALAIAAGAASNAEILITEAWELARVPRTTWETLQPRLEDKILVVSHRAPGRLVGRFAETGHIIATDTQVLGWTGTEWLVDNPDRIEELLSAETAATASSQVDELLLDEDEV